MPKISQKNPQVSQEELPLYALKYDANKKVIKDIEAENKKTRIPLEEYAKKFGLVQESGSIVAELTHADKTILLKETIRASKVLTAQAADILKAGKFTDCFETIEIIREDILEQMILNEQIPIEDVQRIYELKTSYAFSVDIEDRFKAE